MNAVSGDRATKKSRQANLDIIRIIAPAFVFMIHGVETVRGVSPRWAGWCFGIN